MAVNFMVWSFPTAEAAQRVQRGLERPGPFMATHDAAVVSWPKDRRRPITWQAHVGGGNALSGVFWGLLFGLTFLLPASRSDGAGTVDDLCGDAKTVGATGSEFDGCLSHLGLDAEFIATLRRHVGPGSSALLVLAPTTLDRALTTLASSSYGPTVAALTDRQNHLLRHAFADDE
jgi:uncharacterized membrane protein